MRSGTIKKLPFKIGVGTQSGLGGEGTLMDISFRTLITHPILLKTVQSFMAAVLIWVAVRFAKMIASRKIEDKDYRYKIRKALSLAGAVLLLAVILTIFSTQMANLTMILGALSVGIGFSLREVIQSLFGWLVVSIWGLYKPGERIQIGKVMGDVIDINPMITTVMECGEWVKADLYNGRLVRLSNSLIFTDHVINYTAGFPFLWDEIVIPVRTVSDHRLARRIIEQAAQEVLPNIGETLQQSWQQFVRIYRVEEASLDPFVTMSFDSNYIEFTLRYIVDYRVRRSTKDKLFSRILADIEETHGKVQIGSTTVEVSEMTSLSVHLDEPI
ncbi:MAG: mechanosensitive ion channel family protein [Leptospirales bacterium]